MYCVRTRRYLLWRSDDCEAYLGMQALSAQSALHNLGDVRRLEVETTKKPDAAT